MNDEVRTPRGNPDLFGHEAAEAALLSAWRSGRMSHAWIVAGPRGIGKATLAYRFARFVLAQGASAGGGLFGAEEPRTLAVPTGDPVFRRVAAGGHADLVSIERAVNPETGKMRGEIVIDQVRAVGEFLHLTPVEGGWRVVVIDCADELNPNAANALLKVLEEPPARALLLLVSHSPRQLLPTIRSRCRILPLKPLASATVGQLVARYRPELTAAERDVLVELSDGSIGRALGLADFGGVELHREVETLLGKLPQLDATAMHDFAERMARQKTNEAGEGADGFDAAVELLATWVSRHVKSLLGGQRARAEPWLRVWDDLAQLPVRTRGLNLDRKAALVDALLAIEGASARA